MLVKNGIVPINMKVSYTFCRNGETSFIDVVSTDRGLAKKYVREKIPKVWTTSEHMYVLHDFRTKKTRRNLENFKSTSKDADLNKVVLRFDKMYDKVFSENTRRRRGACVVTLP